MSGGCHPGLDRLLDVVRRLRGEGGCPWDREQTLISLKPYAIEEAHELAEAVDSGDPARHRDELGDVLLQVALHAQIRSETGTFSFDDVATTLADKLVRRHPHVFGDQRVSGSEEVLKNWETIKAGERGRPAAHSIVEGIPLALPALQKAERVQSRAARVGFDWQRTEDVAAKVEEELGEVRRALAGGDAQAAAAELGDLLFAVVNLARFLKVHPEETLNAATAKFVRRFQELDARLQSRGRRVQDCTAAELDAEWEQVKRDQAASQPAPRA